MKRVLFLYLKAFSLTGGIEKFNSCILKALHELSVDGYIDASAMSMYDRDVNEKYLAKKRFKGFFGNRLFFVVNSIYFSLKNDIVVIGHINLAIIGLIIKKIKPSVQLILIAHGIEIWNKQTGNKLKLLQKTDLILAVSAFTKEKILSNNPFVQENSVKIFHNTIDPYFKAPKNFNKPQYLLDRYNIKTNEKVLLTVTRLSSTEKYKGYDNMFSIIHDLNKQSKTPIKYLLGGKYDASEFERVSKLIDQCRAAEYTQLLGFIPDEELIDHYLLADLFVMPSKKEGFGIVFIEAMACGIKVIGGNKDGSVDALQNGALGSLVDPDSKSELFEAVISSLNNPNHNSIELQEKVFATFGFDVYKERLKNYLCA